MTHQDIIDRMEALGLEHSAAYKAERARIAKERESLQELCGGLGHFWRGSPEAFLAPDLRRCVFCDAAEPAKAA